MREPLRSTFDEELEAIKSGILIMSKMVVETIPKGTEALLEGNLTTAQEILGGCLLNIPFMKKLMTGDSWQLSEFNYHISS